MRAYVLFLLSLFCFATQCPPNKLPKPWAWCILFAPLSFCTIPAVLASTASCFTSQDLIDRLIAVNSDVKMNSLFHYEQSHTFGLRWDGHFFLYYSTSVGKHIVVLDKHLVTASAYVYAHTSFSLWLTWFYVLWLPRTERLIKRFLDKREMLYIYEENISVWQGG